MILPKTRSRWLRDQEMYKGYSELVVPEQMILRQSDGGLEAELNL